MFDKERSPRERIIKPEVKLAGRIMVTELWRADGCRLDQLATEILPKFRYDQPMEMLKGMTKSPLTVTTRPDGSRSVRYPVHFDGEEMYGDCIGLANKLLTDEEFNSWLAELRDQCGCRIFPLMVFGTAPRYFLSERMAHYWVMLQHEKTRTRLLVDPSFQIVGLGVGYRYDLGNTRLVDTEDRIPSVATACLQVARGINDDCGFNVLGLTAEKKIILIGFAFRGTLADGITPLARLVDYGGKVQTYHDDPHRGILQLGSESEPEASDRETLAEFFWISQGLPFQFSGF